MKYEPLRLLETLVSSDSALIATNFGVGCQEIKLLFCKVYFERPEVIHVSNWAIASSVILFCIL